MRGVGFVYMVIKKIVTFIKIFILNNLFKVHYFSDIVQGNPRMVKTFLTSVTLNMILMFLFRGLPLHKARDSTHISAALKGTQPELVFIHQ